MINEEVRALTVKRLELEGPEEPEQNQGKKAGVRVALAKKADGGDDQAAGCCAECAAPLWLRRDEEEELVQLCGCGCVLHECCVIEASTRQHGMTLPSISDPGHFLVLLRRMFGIDSINVDSLRCPKCDRESRNWWKVKPMQTVVVGAVEFQSIVEALKKGETPNFSSLRAATCQPSTVKLAGLQQAGGSEYKKEVSPEQQQAYTAFL